jgi:hypothetical protein
MVIDKEEYIFGEVFERDCDNPPDIFYCKTDYVSQFLKFAEKIPNDFVVVSHNSDHAITQDVSDYIDSNLPNLKAWFGQNIDCYNDRIHSIPIGLENTKNWTKFSKEDLLYTASTISKIPTKLAYANFSMWTNPFERKKCYEIVKNSNFITDKCKNDVIQDEYEKWLYDVVDHNYVLCPRGNGIDTHRLWETLYLGRIPITIRNANTRFYEDKLPILLVDDWDEITENLLTDKLILFSDKSNFNFDLMKINYWIKEIRSKLK